jgi:hypothetical protein
VALESVPSHLAADGITAIRSAFKTINTNNFIKWQNWPVQDMVDQYTIKILFNLA